MQVACIKTVISNISFIVYSFKIKFSNYQPHSEEDYYCVAMISN